MFVVDFWVGEGIAQCVASLVAWRHFSPFVQHVSALSSVSSYLHWRQPFAMAYATKDQIRNHVVELLTSHSHLSALALAVLKKYHVILHLAGGSTDLRAIFGKDLEMYPMLGVCHIVGSQRDGVSLLSARSPRPGFPIRMNNWSAAEPYHHVGLFLPSGCELTDQLAQIGLLLVPTCAAECGMDAWAHALHLPRCAHTYLSLRMELSRFLLQHSDDPIWHNIWHCLGNEAVAENVGGGSGGHDGGDGGGSGRHDGGDGGCSGARGSSDGVSRGRGVSRGLGVSRGSGKSTATPKSRSTVNAKAKVRAKALVGWRFAVKGKGRGKATVSRSALGRGKGK